MSAADGVLLVDKPPECTSHDVVGRVRRLYGTRRVGHAGTLDPNATGLLLLGVGRGTRLLTFLSGLDKTYATTIVLGRSTVTDDVWGEVTAQADPVDLQRIAESQVRDTIAAQLTGAIQQVPSAVSAVKVNGVRAYRRVRQGEQVELPARNVIISSFDVAGIRRLPDGTVELDAVVSCSSGTYIRALARDLGALLGVGGCLSALRRTRVGPFSVSEAIVLPPRDSDEPAPEPWALGAAAARVLPVRELAGDEVAELRFGRPVASTGGGPGPVAALDAEGDLVAVVADERGRARPRFVVPGPGPVQSGPSRAEQSECG